MLLGRQNCEARRRLRGVVSAAAAAAAVGGSERAQLLIRHALKPMDAGAVSAKI